jgi:hypothetical protein
MDGQSLTYFLVSDIVLIQQLVKFANEEYAVVPLEEPDRFKPQVNAILEHVAEVSLGESPLSSTSSQELCQIP